MNPQLHPPGGTARVAPFTTVRTADRYDLVAVSYLLAQSFRHDVPAVWTVADADRRVPVLAAFFEVVARDAMGDGAVDLVVDSRNSPLGAAIWFDRSVPRMRLENATPAMDPRLATVFGPDTARWQAIETALSARHPDDPHQHLYALAVLPGHQREGVAGRLLRAGHERIGPAAAYVTATSQDGRDFFLAHGYTDLETPIDVPDGPSFWPLWRTTDTSPSAPRRA